ncbi:MAG: type II toxin-antitoxin system PemK/MazF family toxin [Candidatus Scalindua sp.]
MTNYNFGEIVLLKFPHSEGKGVSKRPVVVLAQVDVKDIVVSKVTSTEQRGSYDIVINDWEKIGLLFPSVIRVDKLATLSKDRVIKKIGTLSEYYNSIIKDKIKQLFHVE